MPSIEYALCSIRGPCRVNRSQAIDRLLQGVAPLSQPVISNDQKGGAKCKVTRALGLNTSINSVARSHFSGPMNLGLAMAEFAYSKNVEKIAEYAV